MRPRILQILHDGQHTGGVGAVVHGLLRHLGDRFDFAVAHPTPGRLHLITAQGSPAASWRTEVIGWPAPFDAPLAEQGLRELLWRARPDLVHVQHLLHWPLAVIESLVSLDVPLAVSLHDYDLLTPQWALPPDVDLASTTSPAYACRLFGSAASAGWLARRRRLVMRLLARADVRIVPSLAMARVVRQVSRLPLHVVEPGVEPIPRQPARGLGDGPPFRDLRFGFVGRMSSEKGVATLLEAFRRLRGRHPDVRLSLHGPGTPPALPNGVTCAGPFRRDEVAAVMAGFDVGVIPSEVAETCCLVLSEMWMAGRPVVASDAGALADRVVDGGRLFRWGDVDGLSRAMAWFVEHGAWRDWTLPTPRTAAQCAADHGGLYDGLLRLPRRPPREVVPGRVGLVTSAFACGGVETFILRLGARLQALGWDVEVVTTADRGAWFDEIGARGLRARHVSGLRRLPTSRHARRVGRWLARQRYDALVLNNAPLAQAALPEVGPATAVFPVLHGVEPFVFRIAASNPSSWDVAVAVSPGVAALGRDRLGGAIVHIPPGVELPDDEAWRRRAPHGRPFRLVYAGRLEGPKGVRHLLPVLQRCRARGLDVRLDVLGDGPLEAALRAEAVALGLGGAVAFHGRVAPAEIPSHLLQGHALLFPSHAEGLGLVLLEAQACGCVPLATRLAGVTDGAVRDGSTGRLLPAGDEEAFADAVAALCGDAQAWREMSEAGRAHVAAAYTVDLMAARWAALLGETLGGRRPPRPPGAIDEALLDDLRRWPWWAERLALAPP